MSDETAAELARQIQTNEELRHVIEQMRREIGAERAARQRYDRIVAAARVAVAGGGYEQLAAALDDYDRLVRR